MTPENRATATEIIPAQSLAAGAAPLPALIEAAGPAAAFVWDEFFTAGIRKPKTRQAHAHAVRRFLDWADAQGDKLARLTPGMVDSYLDGLPGTIPTKKQHLAALGGFFDALVLRHVVILNPAFSVKAERYEVIEGKTLEIAIERVRTLLASLDTGNVVGLRDRAVIGAVSKLRRKDLRQDGGQWTLRFDEKRGKNREIPLRYDLQGMVLDYLEAAALVHSGKDAPLFPSAIGKTKQHLAGHSDARTTRLYDRRQQVTTRRLVEPISV